MSHKHKKNLGQNWLIDTKVIGDIITANDLSSKSLVIEVGPGEGVLTKALLETGAKVIAIEKDRDLHDIINQKFKGYGDKFNLVAGDVRDINLQDLTDGQDYLVIANIPYYITGLLLRLFLTAKSKPQSMTVLVQREVADRIIASDGKESVLSLSVKCFAKVQKVRNVKAGAFRPIPKVDSAVIKLDEISDDWFKQNNITEAAFFNTIKQAFNQKRKTLRSTLGLPDTNQLHSARPETLSLTDWVKVIKITNP